MLILLGVVWGYLRHHATEVENEAQSDSHWQLKYVLSFESSIDVENPESATVLYVSRPLRVPFAEIVEENFANSDSSLQVEKRERLQDYRITVPKAGKYDIIAEFDINLHSSRMNSQNVPLESLSAVRRDQYTSSEEEFPTQSPRIGDVLKDAPTGDVSESQILEYFFNFCLTNLEQASGDDEGDNVPWALAFKRTTDLGRAKVFVTLCRAAKIPARLVTGFELRHNNQARPHVWAEIHRNNQWVMYDPSTGHSRGMAHSYIPIRRGGENIIRARNPKTINITNESYSMTRLAPSEGLLESEVKKPIQIFDLTRLPLEMHELLSLMLLLPFGALITAVFRNLIGLRTLGTFAPALLAMSFIYAAWGTGLVVLVVVVMIGLAGRAYLQKLHLLMVPRLSIVLTLIIMCVALGVSILNYFNPTGSIHAVLLPMVILTILIERYYVTAEEDGTGFALQLVLGTLVVAAFCYMLLRWDRIGNFVLVYPEIHFITIAAFVLIGRYSGYRLTELWRFGDFSSKRSE